MQNIPVLAVVGPTASGKTALSVALAKRLSGEIVSADSMQIYKGMDIASAKPTEAEKQGIPHHMMDFLSPETPYSVAEYVKAARACIFEIHARGNLPILVGGTGLYVDSLLSDTQFIETDTDLQLRASLETEFDTLGGEKMLEKLAAFDCDTAARLHPNNRKRIIRAFEVYKLTGKTMTQALAVSREKPSPFAPKYIGIAFENRANLYDRINRRVDVMLENGLLEEARAFYGGTPDTAAQAIGYKELKPYLDGILPLGEAVENLKRATRNYAKRQITWFKRNPQIHWIYADTCSNEALQASAVAFAETESV